MQKQSRVRIPANVDRYQHPIADYDNFTLGAADFRNERLQVPPPRCASAPLRIVQTASHRRAAKYFSSWASFFGVDVVLIFANRIYVPQQ